MHYEVVQLLVGYDISEKSYIVNVNTIASSIGNYLVSLGRHELFNLLRIIESAWNYILCYSNDQGNAVNRFIIYVRAKLLQLQIFILTVIRSTVLALL